MGPGAAASDDNDLELHENILPASEGKTCAPAHFYLWGIPKHIQPTTTEAPDTLYTTVQFG